MRYSLTFLPSNFVELKKVTLSVVACSRLLFSKGSSCKRRPFYFRRPIHKSYKPVSFLVIMARVLMTEVKAEQIKKSIEKNRNI